MAAVPASTVGIVTVLSFISPCKSVTWVCNRYSIRLPWWLLLSSVQRLLILYVQVCKLLLEHMPEKPEKVQEVMSVVCAALADLGLEEPIFNSMLYKGLRVLARKLSCKPRPREKGLIRYFLRVGDADVESLLVQGFTGDLCAVCWPPYKES